jgi:hypothetical protein
MALSGSYYVNRQTAEAAVQMALPMIQEAMKRKEVGESGFLYLVVMDPALTPAHCSFEEAILYEYAVGDREKWDADYAAYAYMKARAAWRTGKDGHAVHELHPHMMTAADPVLYGSVVIDGIVVSSSGANPWYDEAFAGTVALCMKAMAKAAVLQERNR